MAAHLRHIIIELYGVMLSKNTIKIPGYATFKDSHFMELIRTQRNRFMREFNDIECCLSNPMSSLFVFSILVYPSTFSLSLSFVHSLVWFFVAFSMYTVYSSIPYVEWYEWYKRGPHVIFELRSAWKWNQSKLLVLLLLLLLFGCLVSCVLFCAVNFYLSIHPFEESL